MLRSSSIFKKRNVNRATSRNAKKFFKSDLLQKERKSLSEVISKDILQERELAHLLFVLVRHAY